MNIMIIIPVNVTREISTLSPALNYRINMEQYVKAYSIYT